MTLGGFGLPLFAAGLAALAAALFALQRLRVRHREVRVPTVIFWREAVEESRARVLVRRFRHPWAYALILAAASLLWLAAAGPRAGGDPAVERLLLLDGSAAMRAPGRFTAAADALRARAAASPRARTRVVLAAGRPLTLLAPDEELALLGRRLEGLAVEACPSTLADAIAAAAAALAPDARLEAEVFGDGALDPGRVAALGARVSVRRATPPPEGGAAEPILAAFGVSEAASGAWDRVDLYARSSAGPAPSLELDGAPLPVEPAAEDLAVVARDVPARGGSVRARLDGRAAAERVLPDRTPIRVALAPGAPPALAAALAADSGVALVAEEPEIAIRAAGSGFRPGLPALEWTLAASGGAAFTVRGPAADAGDELRRSFDRLGLREVDAVGLAEQAGRPIELRFLVDDAGRSIQLWSALLGDDFDFTRSRSFPLFLGAAVRWLAGEPELAAEHAAGRDAAGLEAPLRDADGAALDGAGANFRLPRAGDWTDARGTLVSAALLDPALADLAAAGTFRGEAGAASAGFDPLPWIAALALALLVGEWILFRRGRIP